MQIEKLRLYYVSYLRYDPCRHTSTCSRRRPWRSHFILCIVQYTCTLSGWGINSFNEPNQIISNCSSIHIGSWVSLLITVRGITGIKPEALRGHISWYQTGKKHPLGNFMGKGCYLFSLLNPQRKGVFYKQKGRGEGGHYGPVISARSNWKRLISSGY